MNGAARTRDAGLIIARSETAISEIFALPPEEREAKLIEYARRQHQEAEVRAREQIRRIIEGE